MNCDKHPEIAAIYWREGPAKKGSIYMCRSCLAKAAQLGLVVHEIEPPSEHCPECGTRTGGGRCMTCNDLRNKELSA